MLCYTLHGRQPFHSPSPCYRFINIGPSIVIRLGNPRLTWSKRSFQITKATRTTKGFNLQGGETIWMSHTPTRVDDWVQFPDQASHRSFQYTGWPQKQEIMVLCGQQPQYIGLNPGLKTKHNPMARLRHLPSSSLPIRNQKDSITLSGVLLKALAFESLSKYAHCQQMTGI